MSKADEIRDAAERAIKDAQVAVAAEIIALMRSESPADRVAVTRLVAAAFCPGCGAARRDDDGGYCPGCRGLGSRPPDRYRRPRPVSPTAPAATG